MEQHGQPRPGLRAIHVLLFVWQLLPLTPILLLLAGCGAVLTPEQEFKARTAVFERGLYYASRRPSQVLLVSPSTLEPVFITSYDAGGGRVVIELMTVAQPESPDGRALPVAPARPAAAAGKEGS